MKHHAIPAGWFAAPNASADIITWSELNARIAAHAARQAEHEAAITRTLDEMATRHVEDAAFLVQWNAMSYREAVAYQAGTAARGDDRA